MSTYLKISAAIIRLINKSQKHIKKLEKLEIFVSRGFPPPYFEMYGC